jgi:uncharacterized iron-regulated membrane protein
MKKFIRQLHLWLSVPFGLIITVICFSGAALVFEPELMKLCNPTRHYVEEVKGAPLPLGQLIANVNRQLPDSTPIANVQIPASAKENYRLGFPGRGTPPFYVDPYTGVVRDHPAAGQGNFFLTMRRLHRFLLDDFKYGGPPSVGKLVVGVSTLVFVLIIIGGVVMWIPKNRKALRANLSIKVRSTWKRLLRDLHVTLGIYAALLLLAMALTGLTWSFSWYRNGFYRIFGAEPPQMSAPARVEGNRGENQGENRNPNPNPNRGEGNRGEGRGEGRNPNRGESNRGEGRGEGRNRGENQDGSRGEGRAENRRGESGGINYSRWQVVADTLKAQYPRFKSLTIQNGRASVSLSSVGNVRASDSYTFDPETGYITSSALYKDANRSGKIRGWIYSVHVGSWGGMFTRILSFLAALFGATLPLTGYYLWISRAVRKRKRRKFS